MEDEVLGCPKCSVPLAVAVENPSERYCPICQWSMVEQSGVHHALDTLKVITAQATVDNFGKRWNQVHSKMGGLKSFLLPMIFPVTEAFFREKTILDMGCGFGRLSRIMLEYGARHVVGLDASAAVENARDYLQEHLSRVTLVRGDILLPPLLPEKFDCILCHGVLHHTGAPREALRQMRRLLKEDHGTLILWVYAQEGNVGLRRLLNVVRTVSLRTGFRVNWGLAMIADAVLWSLTHLIYTPLDRLFQIKSSLWYGEYLLDFLYVKAINNRADRLQMFHDFLTTEIVEYYSRQQLQSWLEEDGYRNIHFYFYRKQSWGVSASL